MLVTRSHTLYEGHFVQVQVIVGALALCLETLLQLFTGNHAGKGPIAIGPLGVRINMIKPGGQDHRIHIELSRGTRCGQMQQKTAVVLLHTGHGSLEM